MVRRRDSGSRTIAPRTIAPRTIAPRFAIALCVTAAFTAIACAQQQDGSPPRSGPTRSSSRQSQRAPGINERLPCTVTHVSDGDSVVCAPLGRVRLLLIDAPELSAGTTGRAARGELLAMMPLGTEVVAETDVQTTDKFGRVLAYMFLPDGEMINEKMAAGGFVTVLVYPPNVKYVERIRAAVAEARTARRGLWATDAFNCEPRDYRAGRCR